MQLFLSLYDGKDRDDAVMQRRILLAALPAVQMVLTGSVRSGLGSFGQRRQVGGARDARMPGLGDLIVFKSDTDADAALATDVGKALRDGAAELDNFCYYSGHGAAVVPFDGRQKGQRCFAIIGAFTLNPEFGSVEKAEHHYATEHTRICARVPGCQGYLGALVENAPAIEGEPYRLAISFFADEASWRSQLGKPAVEAIERDASGFSKIAKLLLLDATVQL